MIISAGASSLGAFFAAYGGGASIFFNALAWGGGLGGESTEKVEKRDFRAVGNGYKPLQNLYYIHYFYSFSVLSPLACFAANNNVSAHFQQTKRTVPLVCGLQKKCPERVGSPSGAGKSYELFYNFWGIFWVGGVILLIPPLFCHLRCRSLLAGWLCRWWCESCVRRWCKRLLAS